MTSASKIHRDERTLVDRAVDVLREEIVAGELAPGDRVHLADAAGRLGMSMVPVREALRSLASEGLVVAIPQRGYRVSAVSAEDLEDTYRLRLVLDPMATELAVPRMSEEDLDELRETMDSLQLAYETGDWALHRVEHRRFHFTIYGACGSPRLISFIETLWSSSYRYQRLSSAKRGSTQDRAGEHRRILEACEQRDPELSALLMRKHLELTRRSVEASLMPLEAVE